MTALFEVAPSIPGLFTVWNGRGVPAEHVATSGEHGAGLMDNDRALPADTGVELRAAMVSAPTGAGLVSWVLEENGALEVEVGSDGVVSWSVELFADGVSQGVAPGSITIGAGGGAAAVLRQAARYYNG